MILNTQQFIGLKLEVNQYEKFCQKYRYSPTSNEYQDMVNFLLLYHTGIGHTCESSILVSSLTNELVLESSKYESFKGYNLNELFKCVIEDKDKNLVNLKLAYNELISIKGDDYYEIREAIDSVSDLDNTKIWAINVAIKSFLND